jgi:hypothetical protein
MGQNRLLICIPTKTDPEYLERAAICEATWLRDCPCDYKFFRDVDYGLDEQDPLVRQQRMKAMCRYALSQGYDFIFRVDSDAFVAVPKLLTSDFEAHDYMGWCLEYTGWKARNRTAHGGAGFFLSRKAMELVVAAQHFAHDHIYWADIWTGQLLYDVGISCVADARFVEGNGTDFTPDNLPSDWISVHPCQPEMMSAIFNSTRKGSSA